MKLHVSTNYVVFLKTLKHTKPTIKLNFRILDKNEESFHVLLTVHTGMILVHNQLDAQYFMYVFSILYMFRTNVCQSSGELLYQCDTWFM